MKVAEATAKEKAKQTHVCAKPVQNDLNEQDRTSFMTTGIQGLQLQRKRSNGKNSADWLKPKQIQSYQILHSTENNSEKGVE